MRRPLPVRSAIVGRLRAFGLDQAEVCRLLRDIPTDESAGAGAHQNLHDDLIEDTQGEAGSFFTPNDSLFGGLGDDNDRGPTASDPSLDRRYLGSSDREPAASYANSQTSRLNQPPHSGSAPRPWTGGSFFLGFLV